MGWCPEARKESAMHAKDLEKQVSNLPLPSVLHRLPLVHRIGSKVQSADLQWVIVGGGMGGDTRKRN